MRRNLRPIFLRNLNQHFSCFKINNRNILLFFYPHILLFRRMLLRICLRFFVAVNEFHLFILYSFFFFFVLFFFSLSNNTETNEFFTNLTSRIARRSTRQFHQRDYIACTKFLRTRQRNELRRYELHSRDASHTLGLLARNRAGNRERFRRK